MIGGVGPWTSSPISDAGRGIARLHAITTSIFFSDKEDAASDFSRTWPAGVDSGETQVRGFMLWFSLSKARGSAPRAPPPLVIGFIYPNCCKDCDNYQKKKVAREKWKRVTSN